MQLVKVARTHRAAFNTGLAHLLGCATARHTAERRSATCSADTNWSLDPSCATQHTTQSMQAQYTGRRPERNTCKGNTQTAAQQPTQKMQGQQASCRLATHACKGHQQATAQQPTQSMQGQHTGRRPDTRHMQGQDPSPRVRMMG